MKFFMAGNDVPEWLQKVEPLDDEKFVKPEIKFKTPTVVYVRNDQYVIRPLIGKGRGEIVWQVKNGRHCGISGQSPNNSGKAAITDAIPIITYVEAILFCIMACALTYLLH